MHKNDDQYQTEKAINSILKVVRIHVYLSGTVVIKQIK